MLPNHALIVDDYSESAILCSTALESGGRFRCHVESSHEGGLRSASEDPPDVIIVDLMRDDTGLEFLEALHEDPRTRGIPVVVATARVQAERVALYLRKGAKDVIAKPFDPLAVADRVTAWISR